MKISFTKHRLPKCECGKEIVISKVFTPHYKAELKRLDVNMCEECSIIFVLALQV